VRWWRVRRVPIRLKVAAALATPLVVVAVYGVAEARQASQRAEAVRRQADFARAVVGPAGLITTLQNERTWLNIELEIAPRAEL
jgi:hypothetical protein